MAISIQIYITKFHVTQLDIKTASSLTLLKHGTTFVLLFILVRHYNFNNQICALIRPNIKLSFNIHYHQGLKYIFQLRVGLSLLRSH